MIKTNDLQSIQNSINHLRNCETLDKDSAIDCLDEIFAILLKMNKMKIKSYPYSYETSIVLENEK
tara:strand:- start:96 stop:290 length:195 start_codon:yes stop_codon:yes gene_type:complete